VNTAIRMAYRKRKLPKAKQILLLAEKWKPYRSFACWYFWRYIERERADAAAAKKNGANRGKKVKAAKA
jgi:3-methyladenine DNA glycosylase/8-oxoguanine DNA glycosylase